MSNIFEITTIVSDGKGTVQLHPALRKSAPPPPYPHGPQASLFFLLVVNFFPCSFSLATQRWRVVHTLSLWIVQVASKAPIKEACNSLLLLIPDTSTYFLTTRSRETFLKKDAKLKFNQKEESTNYLQFPISHCSLTVHLSWPDTNIFVSSII